MQPDNPISWSQSMSAIVSSIERKKDFQDDSFVITEKSGDAVYSFTRLQISSKKIAN